LYHRNMKIKIKYLEGHLKYVTVLEGCAGGLGTYSPTLVVVEGRSQILVSCASRAAISSFMRASSSEELAAGIFS
jgi:hypothetical protein